MSSRDIASLLILACLVGVVLTSRAGRDATVMLWRALFGRLLAILLLYYAYLVSVVAISSQLGAWTPEVLKDTIVWFAIAGITFFAKFSEVGRYPRVLRRRLLEFWGIGTIVEFVFNLVTFPLAVEIVMAVVLTLLYLTLAVASAKAETRSAAHIIQTFLGLVVLVLAASTLAMIYRSRGELELEQLVMSLALMYWLPLAAMPAIYALGLYSSYERVSSSLRALAPVQRRMLITAVVLILRGRVRLVHALGGGWLIELADCDSWDAARRSLLKYRRTHRETPGMRARDGAARLSSDLRAGCVDPSSPAGQLACGRPPGWEWLLYVQVLTELARVVDDHHALLQRGPVMYRGRLPDTGAAVRAASEIVDPLADLPRCMDAALDPEAQERAFGEPGVAGDAPAIVELAGELVESYAAFLWSAASTRALDVRPNSAAIVSLRDATARLAAEPAQQIREFIDALADRFARVPAQLEAGDVIAIEMTLTLTLPDATLRNYEDALAGVARVHRPSPFH